MDILERVQKTGLVPVVAFDDAEQAVPCSAALLAGQLDIIEITMRTAAGIESIRRVKKAYPDMLIGAGTVLTLEKAKESVDAGAEFIVLPGYQEDVVSWCVANKVAVLPGCVTPAEIQLALQKGLKTLKFFPADVYGGVKAMKSLNGPFGSSGVKFIPTGGVDAKNLSEYVRESFIAAVGGGWLCSSKQIKSADYDGITKTVKEAIDILLGFEFAHLGINTNDADQSEKVTKEFESAFHFPYIAGNSSNFAGTAVEVNKTKGLGQNGHFAIRTNSIERAEYYLEKRGYVLDHATAKKKDGKLIAVYLKNEIGGFAIHLLQK